MTALPVLGHFYDFVTGTYQSTLPLPGLKFGDLLNGAGPFSTTDPIPLSDQEIRNLDPWDATTPGKRLLVVDINGAIAGTYIVEKRNRKMTKQGLTISGSGLYNWFTRRMQATDYSNPPWSGIVPGGGGMTYWTAQGHTPYQGADPTLIAAQLISDALANYSYDSVTTGLNVLGGLGILINGLPPNASAPVSSGVLITPTYPYSQIQSLDTILQQLVAMGWMTGFDIIFSVRYSAGPRSPLVGTIDITYPRQGRTAAANGLAIDMNQARDYSIDEDATKQGSTQYEQGIPGTLEIVDNTYPRAQGWPQTEQVQNRTISIATGGSTGFLASIGQSDSYLYSFPYVSGTVTMPLWGTDPQFGSFITGDDAILKYAGDYNFPAGFDDEFRIVGWTATVPDNGEATIDYQINLPPAAMATAPAV
ncbi:MAG: hypothetical protein JWO62_2643 [Acidimicrobiaceae bacterium]|nr:hypothetical protein [Acidimicrobiaceae bacterium]